METPHALSEQLKTLPTDPGVYKYFNKSNTLIYVGKAKNLKKRVSSYFNKTSGISLKTKKLVSEIVSLEYVIVNTEFDALLLENNLIKENQPKYNILLKDDKSFPFICISNERFPKIFSTRRREKEEGEYYGPYTNVRALNNVLELLQKLYKIRTCNYALSEKNIQEKKFKICLEYHVKNCLGPCEGLQTEDSYLEEIEHAKLILKGNLKQVHDHFKAKMLYASEKLNFEEAQEYKAKIESLEGFQSKTIIVNKNLKNIDAITITSTDKIAFVNYLKIDQGMINISESFSVTKKLEESDNEILALVAHRLRKKYNSTAKLLLSNISFDSWDENIEVLLPKIGDKKAITNLSLKNAMLFKKEHIEKATRTQNRSNRVVKQLQEDLKLQKPPITIECFDNSNIQGTNPVASMVCFKNGNPSKKNYRHFKIKTVIGPDDFGSMTEVVGRRYKRLLDENEELPDLIIIDGGKGQLSAACEALKELNVYNQIPIIGIAKRLEEIYYPEDTIPIHISKKSESLKLIQHLRDEAHRFAITFHRNLRSNAQLGSELDEIKGIGKNTREVLLERYKSYKKIVEQPIEELAMVIGQSKAQKIILHAQKKGSIDPS